MLSDERIAELAKDISGPCTCSESYTSRDRDDPTCDYHNMFEAAQDAIRTAVREAAEEAARIAEFIPDIPTGYKGVETLTRPPMPRDIAAAIRARIEAPRIPR